MATILDFGLLQEFSAVFAWILLFVVVFGVLQMSKIFDNMSFNALAALAVTVIMFSAGGTTELISGLVPWFVITAFFVMFLLILAKSVGIEAQEVTATFGGKGVIWWFFAILVIGVVISLVASGQFSRGETEIDPETGEEVKTTGTTVLSIITQPKVLGVILIMSISAIAIALMAGVPKMSG